MSDCTTDCECTVCELRRRAEQAERERDEWQEAYQSNEAERSHLRNVLLPQAERERDEALDSFARLMDSFARLMSTCGRELNRAEQAERERDEARRAARGLFKEGQLCIARYSWLSEYPWLAASGEE